MAVAGWPTWADGQAVHRLREAIRAGRSGQAYLISGPRGVGKRALALAFAQALCCTNRDPADRSHACGQCRACRNVARGAHPDVETFDLAAQALLADKPGRGANLSIDIIRRLRSSAAMLPIEGAHRVLIVDDAETLLEPAQQALLKTLEEPPPAVTIVLLSDEAEALLGTIRSRCHEIVARAVPEPSIARALQEHGVAEDLAAEIASLSRGCPAWALAAAGDAKAVQARRADLQMAREWIDADRYGRLVTAYSLGEQFSKRRNDVFAVVQAAIQVLRDEMLGAAGRGSALATGGAGGRPAASPEPFARAIAASLQCLGDLDANVRPRLALEAMVLAWPNLERQPT
jgi:DNA polymerase-3 subunit delta'